MVAELRLQIALLSDEHRHHRVAVVLVDVEGLGHHCEEPAMEILGPVLIVGGQTAGEVFDVVLLSVPGAAGSKELVDGVVVLDVGRLYVSAYVVHPAFAALLHLLYDEALHLSVGQRFPLPEVQVVGAELRDALDRVVAQLVAALQEILDAPHDALFLVHLRDGLPIVRFFVSIAEGAAYEVYAQRLETCVP